MFRYSVVYADPHGAGDARPTALTVVKDEDLVGKLTDKVMLITGGSAGIGAETARAFHATGAKLFLTIAKGRQFSDDTSNRTEIILIKMELYPLDSVRAGAQQVLRRTGRLNVLVNNAGVKAMPQGGTKEGAESPLLKSSTLAFQSRVVCVSSVGHGYSTVYFDHYNFDKPSSCAPWKAYGQLKTANVYLANKIQKRYSSRGLHATSLYPSFIQSNHQVHSGESAESMWKVPEIKAREKSTAQSAAMTVYAPLSRDWEGKGGIYLSNCAVIGAFRKQPPKSVYDDDVTDDGYLPHAYDAACEGRLWKELLKIVGLEDDD